MAAPLRFVARPFVCGALGRPDPGIGTRLRTMRPDLVTIIDAPDALLLASQALAPYRDDEGRRAWAFGDRRPAPGIGWRDAAVSVEAAGLAEDPDEIALHTGAHGLVDVFHRRIGETTWFASRMDPLLDLDDGPLDIDWDDWACRLVLTYAVGDRTPVRQVRRLTGASVLRLDRSSGTVHTDHWTPPWVGLAAPRPGAGDPAAIVDAFRGAVTRTVAAQVSHPLSGGFDSRFMAIILRDLGVTTDAWTVSKDDGRDEIGIARDVADALGLEHHIVPPARAAYPELADEVLDRTGHLVAQHIWAAGLARAMRAQGRQVIDGLAMDILLSNTHIPEAAVRAMSADARDDALLHELSRRHLANGTLTADAARWAYATAGRCWRESIARLRDDPNAAILSVLATRTARGVAAVGQWLYGPDIPVAMPGVDPTFLVVVLSADPVRKIDGRLYREVLSVADPVVAAIRSTRDPDRAWTGGRRDKAGVEGVEWLLRRMRPAGELPGLVDPGLASELEDARHAQLANGQLDDAHTRRLQGLSQHALGLAVMGGWLERHRDRLASLDVPWSRGGSPAFEGTGVRARVRCLLRGGR